MEETDATPEELLLAIALTILHDCETVETPQELASLIQADYFTAGYDELWQAAQELTSTPEAEIVRAECQEVDVQPAEDSSSVEEKTDESPGL